MGGVRYSDKKRFGDCWDKSKSESSHQVLETFYEELISEWVEDGNKAEDFPDKGPQIVMIIDNASFHKKEEYRNLIKSEMPNIHLEFLPIVQITT